MIVATFLIWKHCFYLHLHQYVTASSNHTVSYQCHHLSTTHLTTSSHPQDNFGFDLTAVEASAKKHEAIETDILAYEERVLAVVAVAEELQTENYHDIERINARSVGCGRREITGAGGGGGVLWSVECVLVDQGQRLGWNVGYTVC